MGNEPNGIIMEIDFFKINGAIFNDDMLINFAQYYDDKNQKLRRKFNDSIHSIREENHTYRIINHWESNGLIDSKRKDERGWRKFSLIEIIWLEIIKRLRQFGVSIKNINKIRKQLQRFQDKCEGSSFPELEFLCASFPIHKEPTYLLVYKDFSIDLALQSQMDVLEESLKSTEFIRISLHSVIKTLFPRKDFEPKINNKVVLNDQEMILMGHIRSGFFDEISITMKDGRINRLVKSTKNIERKLNELLSEKNYDTITLKRENGNIVSISQDLSENT